MFSSIARIFGKPVSVILDGCQNLYNKYNNEKVKPEPTKEPEQLKKSQPEIAREPVTTNVSHRRRLHRYPMDEIDYVYRYNRMRTHENKLAMELKGPYEIVERPPSEPNWLFAMDDLSDSMIQVRKVRPSIEPPKALDDSGFFDDLELDGFLLVLSDDESEDD